MTPEMQGRSQARYQGSARGAELMSTSGAEWWIKRIYDDVPGYLVVNYQDAGGRFHGTGGWCENHEQAAQRITKLDAAAAQSDVP